MLKAYLNLKQGKRPVALDWKCLSEAFAEWQRAFAGKRCCSHCSRNPRDITGFICFRQSPGADSGDVAEQSIPDRRANQ
jgi:hypothetical protein